MTYQEGKDEFNEMLRQQQDEDGGYYATGEQWERFDESDIYHLKYAFFAKEAEGDVPPTDERTDQFIVEALNDKGLRRDGPNGVEYNSLANANEWEEAVYSGCRAWLKEVKAMKTVVDGHRPLDADNESVLFSDATIRWGNGEVQHFPSLTEARAEVRAIQARSPILLGLRSRKEGLRGVERGWYF